MMRPRRGSTPGRAAVIFTAAMLLASGGWADEGDRTPPGSPYSDIDRLIERELNRLFDHLEGVLEDLPRYALPEVTEEGDIIIRRLPRRPEGWRRESEDPDGIVDL